MWHLRKIDDAWGEGQREEEGKERAVDGLANCVFKMLDQAMKNIDMDFFF